MGHEPVPQQRPQPSPNIPEPDRLIHGSSVTIRERHLHIESPAANRMIHSGTFTSSKPVEEVFAFLANPELFAPMMPDFESMTMQDATHFLLRIVIQAGPITGHANLNMESQTSAPSGPVVYDGQAIIAGSPLRLRLEFVLDRAEATTMVNWRGEVALGGSLALLAGGLLESTGRNNFERMAQKLHDHLGELWVPETETAQSNELAGQPEYEI